MFERFTPEARAVVIRAQEESRRLQHAHIGTEHILLGLLATPTNVAARALLRFGVTASTVNAAIEEEVGRGKETLLGHIPFTRRAKKLLELALREALQLKHNYIGSEHILLAIEREGEGLAAQILASQVPDLAAVRGAVLELLGGERAEDAGGGAAPRTTAADEVVTTARALAGDAPMGSHHLLEALVRAEGSMAAKVLSDLGIDPAAIAAKVDEFDAEDTTDANPEETAARKMELRVVPGEAGDEVHVVFRDEATVAYAKLVTRLTDGPITPTGPVTGRFVPVWRATNNLLTALHQSLREDPLPGDVERGKAALLVRRVLHDRLRRRGRDTG